MGKGKACIPCLNCGVCNGQSDSFKRSKAAEALNRLGIPGAEGGFRADSLMVSARSRMIEQMKADSRKPLKMEESR